MTDAIPGGLAKNRKPSDFDQKQLAAGMQVEREHTEDEAKQRDIAMDHLTEDPQYYEKLKTLERSIAKEASERLTRSLRR